MRLSLSFRFADDELNDRLIRLIKTTPIKHFVDDKRVLHYSPADVDAVENDMICSIRDQAFPSWQVLTCPPECAAQYRDYMSRHDIPFHQELIDAEMWFLIPRKYRPNLWKLASKTKRAKVHMAH